MSKLEIELIRDLVLNGESSYYVFFLEFWETICPEPLIENFHVKLLCDKLQKIGMRVVNRERKTHDYHIINISPAESKSSIVTQLFPVWLWVRDPTIRIITASYSMEISRGHSTKSRDCIEHPKFKSCFGDIVQLRHDSSAKANYHTTAGGQRFSTSPNGSATGIHAHIHIWDDLINPKQAASPKLTQTANSFLFETLVNRKVNAAIVPSIGVMQRLSEDDPTGVILEREKKGENTVDLVKLPATNEFEIHPKELEKYYTDGLMNPFRHPKTVLEKMRTSLGAVGYAKQYGQSPVAMEGNIAKFDYFKRFTFAYLKDLAEKVGEVITWNFTIDSAYTEDKKNDPTGMLAYCFIDSKLFIRNFVEVRKEILDCVAEVELFANQNGYGEKDPVFDYHTESEIAIEPKASGLPIAQVFKRQLPQYNVVIGTSPKFSKEVRFMSKKPFMESQKVYVLRDAPFVDNFLLSLCGFPNLKHDEAVDCLVMAIDQNKKRWTGSY